MKLHLVALMVSLALSETSPGHSMKTPVYSAAEGEDLTLKCLIHDPKGQSIFCKNDCNEKTNILHDSKNAIMNSRYSVERDRSSDVTYVRIKNVRRSDSGTYVFSQRTRTGPVQVWEFGLFVTAGPRHHCWLLLTITMVMTIVLLLGIWRKKDAQNDQERTENSTCPMTETEGYENMRAASPYQTLCVETMEPNQAYCSI